MTESGALDEIFARIDAGEPLTGHSGLIKGMLKASLERGLEAELGEHVGYERGDPDAARFDNSRNGSFAKTVATEIGDVELAVPRDRNGTFSPMLVPTGVRRLDGLDAMIVSLYAGGMTIRDIGHHLASTIGTELSHETISKVTDAVADEVLAWQQRPLEALYPVIYLDAIIVKVRDGGHVRNKAAHIAVGVDMDGVKHVLGIWVQATEGAKFWASVCAELANRGVADVLIVCCDGLTGFPEAIEATWPHATVQTCVVHLIRAAMRFVNFKDRKAVAGALKPIYQAANADGALIELEAFEATELGKRYPSDGRGVPPRLGTLRAVPGVPASVAAGDLHNELDRVAELPAPQSHQEPRALPERRRRRQTALARDLQHRGQTGTRTSERTRHARCEAGSPRTTRRGTDHHELETSPRAAPDRLPRPHRPPPLNTPDQAPYTHNLTRSRQRQHRCPISINQIDRAGLDGAHHPSVRLIEPVDELGVEVGRRVEAAARHERRLEEPVATLHDPFGLRIVRFELMHSCRQRAAELADTMSEPVASADA